MSGMIQRYHYQTLYGTVKVFFFLLERLFSSFDEHTLKNIRFNFLVCFAGFLCCFLSFPGHEPLPAVVILGLHRHAVKK